MDAPASIVVRKRVEWADTDASGWYHNTVVLHWIEQAENELLGRLGLLAEVTGFIPRVHIDVDYRKVLRFRDEVDVELTVHEMGETSVMYRFEVRHEGGLAAEGSFTMVRVTPDGKKRPWSEEHRRLFTASGPR
jgi:acyl-CoA thioester hydrolase